MMLPSGRGQEPQDPLPSITARQGTPWVDQVSLLLPSPLPPSSHQGPPEQVGFLFQITHRAPGDLGGLLTAVSPSRGTGAGCRMLGRQPFQVGTGE